MRSQTAIANLTTAGLIYVALVLGCAPPRTSEQSTTRTSNNTVKTSDKSQPPGRQWDYIDNTDEMGRGRILIARVQSTNTISLHAELSLREHPKHGKDVYIQIQKGQLLDSDYNSPVVVRFDDEKPLSFPTVKPADLSTETLFLRGNAFQVFMTKLRTAKALKVEVPVYQAGNQIFTFDVEGFSWKK